jgi:lysophospholipase L1-like esterase
MPPLGTNSVDVMVFYDETGNGVRNPGERTRIPEALVEIGSRSARSAPQTGEARVDGLTEGPYEVTVRADTLPPFYVPGPPITITVPTDQVVEVPVQLQIGRNTPNRYLGFGDSITEGDSDFGDYTYRRLLQSRLEGHFGVAEILNAGAGGTTTDQGAARIDDELFRNDPAFVLVVYGTNDWNACTTPQNCFTQNSMRSIVRSVKLKGAHAFVATIPPVNVGFDDRVPPERQEWVDDANELIRVVVREEGAVLMDVNAALTEAANGNFSALFEDHVHPNPAGYDIMAQAMFEAIARGQVGAASHSGLIRFGFRD